MNQGPTQKTSRLQNKSKPGDSETLVKVDSPDDFSYEGQDVPVQQRNSPTDV